MTAPNVAIVGGGILGMTLALELADQGYSPTIIEGAGSVGGLVSPHRIGDHQWDRFYHVILPQDRATLALIDRIGLADRVRWERTRTGFYVDGQWHSLSSTWEYLTFPPLGPIDKARLAATILGAARRADGVPLESILVADWLRKWSGRRTFERIWLPLLRAKLGGNYQRVSAAFIWSYLRRLYAARQSGDKREVLGYVEGGYGTVLGALEASLREAGVGIVTGSAAVGVEPSAAGVVVRTADGTGHRASQVILTVPATRVASLCPWLERTEKERLNRVVYQGVVCPSILTTEPLKGFYVTNITDPSVPFTGIVEMTALVDRRTFGGRSLIYLPRYLAQGDPSWAASDEEIETTTLDALERMNAGFRRDQVVAFRVARARDVQALPTLHYSRDVLPPSYTSHPRVHLVNSAQIVNGTLNVHETVTLARRKGAELAKRFAPRGIVITPVPEVVS